MKKLLNSWEKLAIKYKLSTFTLTAWLIILFFVLFDAFIVKYFILDFNQIFSDESNGEFLVEALENEEAVFLSYIRTNSEDSRIALDNAVAASEKAIDDIELDFSSLGEERYAYMYSIKKSYSTYAKGRDEIIGLNENESIPVVKLYQLYDMQDYIIGYAKNYLSMTIADGNKTYNQVYPYVFRVPAIAIFVSIIMLFILMSLEQLMRKNIIKPVLTLAEASKKIANNDFYIDDVETDNQDEIGELVHAFNRMKFATGEYIMALEKRREALDALHQQEVARLEVEKQLEQANLQVLKNQINPHFLFNTLNVIGGMANLEDATATEQMIVALSDLFRYNLKHQESTTTLAQELKAANDYMYLQRMRFGERIQFEVNCNLDTEAVVVPSFTLQPILENSVIHGVTNKLEGGKIILNIEKDDSHLHIIVEDNGAGMDDEELKLLRESLFMQDNTKAGIGMGNLYRRIKHMYADGELTIESIKEQGTKVHIALANNDVEMK